eukprot:jgi/Bigna1/140016/aug1.53_g14724
MKGGEAHVRIAKHYKFALSHAFKTHQDAKYVIIVEEDMVVVVVNNNNNNNNMASIVSKVVSPDFFEYFRVVGGLYEVRCADARKKAYQQSNICEMLLILSR